MKKSAFSLLELAVVILVISIITAGIMKGGSIVNNSRLASARSLTSNSNIGEIEGLVAWYETTLPDSFEKSEVIDNEPLSKWHDVSSQASISERKNSLSRTPDGGVIYRTNGINHIPSVQFTASGRFSLASLFQGNSSRSSVFVVLSPTLDLSGVEMTFIDSYLTGAVNSLVISDDFVRINADSTNEFAASFVQSQNYVIGAYLNQNSSHVFVNNVESSGFDTSVDISGFSGLTVGANKSGSNSFTGLMSEVIVFDRVISEKERIMVMSYLAKKYKIRVSGASY